MPGVDGLVDHLFRHQYGRLVSTLTRIFGIEHLDLVEDVVQETLLRALRQWPFHEVPDNPAGWLYRAAKNQAVDALRREASFRAKAPQIAEALRQWGDAEGGRGSPRLADDALGMIFACCHPALERESRIALTLKTLGGFGVSEIARAFLSTDATIAQRLVRAKRKLRAERIRLEVPEEREIGERLPSVLEVLYLMFNEGYAAHRGEDLVRFDLCEEALRLGTLVVEHPAGDRPAAHALLALMWLQASRLPARQSAGGELVLLADQDRSLWDPRCIRRGVGHLARAGAGGELTRYHLEAGIAACHALAPSHEATDWRRIVELYDLLLEAHASPVVALNRAVALAMLEGPDRGIRELGEVEPALRGYHLFHATLGDFHARAGNSAAARAAYDRALELACTEPERRFLESRRARV